MPMPPRTRLSSPPGPVSRRVVLLGVAGTALSGCTGGLKVRRNGPRRPGRERAEDRTADDVDPDVTLAATALAAEQEALAVVEATQDRHVRLRSTLEPAAATHRAHIGLLADAVPEAQSTEAPVPSGVRVPRSARRAVARLVEVEAELSANGRRHAFAAQSGPFARLLASMAASAAQHAAVLGAVELGRQGRR